MHRHSSPHLVLLGALFAAAAAGQPTPAFNLSVVEAGVYRVTYEELATVAPLGNPPSDQLALTNRGRDVALWIRDGGDGSFDPGDSLEFVGEHLPGEVSFYNEHTRFNVYRLALDPARARRMTVGVEADEALETAQLRGRRHYENDAVRVRFAQRPDDPEEESWFWERLSFLEAEPFETGFDLAGLAPGPARLQLQVRGWSRHRLTVEGVHQHRVEVAVNGSPVAAGEWDGQDVHLVETVLPPDLLRPEANAVTVTVPQRQLDGETDPIVDLSLINWIEVDYPHSGVVTGGQARLRAASEGPAAATLRAPAATSLLVFDEAGQRWDARITSDGPLVRASVAEESALFAVRDEAFRSPAQVTVDRPSDWRSSAHRADYLMIAHPTLLEGSRRLADLHRSRGLEVALVDVQDVYDEFNHGIVHPRAIRDFVAHAYRQWAPPAPRFVLLVGDASWDTSPGEHDDESYADWSYQPREATREGFLKNASTPYEEGPIFRGLIPTGSYRNSEGHAASDNYFVALEEDDFHPQLALGRLPIVDPADLDAIVDKTIRYIDESGVGPWRRQILWISNEEETIQRRTDILADEQAAQGFHGARVYPKAEEASNAEHQERLLKAFGDGQLVVYFHGHGGRYIWRTGPTDYKKNRDLFNLDHLDQLQPSSRLPVVLSMTCFSAPFDHPLADSIGEKFLRLPDRGAIAVFAASWRNSPAADVSRELVEALTEPGITIGEAVLRAKQKTKRRDMIETYNLLGDPAVPVAAPQNRLEVTIAADGEDLRLEAHAPSLGDGFTGRAIVDWLGAGGETVASDEIEIRGDRLVTRLPALPDGAETVSVYVWDAERGVDGIGSLSLAVEPAAAEPASPSR